jgi:hypothetical protein
MEPPKRKDTWATNSHAIGEGLPRPVGAHIMFPHALVARREVTVFNVCSLGFLSCTASISPFYAPSLPFWNDSIYYVLLHVRSM